MPDTNSVIERIQQLSDKQACYIVKSLTQDFYAKMPSAPSFEQLEDQISPLAKEAGVDLDLKSRKEWYAIEMATRASGQTARSLLENLASQPGLDELVNEAISRYSDDALDLGIISIGVAIGMLYVAISSDIEIDLGWFKLKKKGLSAEQQKEVAVKTLPEVAKAFA